MTILSTKEEYCYSPFPDLLQLQKLDTSQTASGGQGSLPVSWNELVFWHDVVKNIKEATECVLKQDSQFEKSYSTRNKVQDVCMEALIKAQRYAKDMCAEDRLELMKRTQSFLDLENETARLVFGKDWQMELNKAFTRENAQGPATSNRELSLGDLLE